MRDSQDLGQLPLVSPAELSLAICMRGLRVSSVPSIIFLNIIIIALFALNKYSSLIVYLISSDGTRIIKHLIHNIQYKNTNKTSSK